MRLLHGTYTEILTPDLSICKGKNDFGKGFYLTPNWKRAWQMGKRSTFLYGGEIQTSDKIDIEALASHYLTEELC